MADLGPQYQNLSYQGLLQVPGGITASLQQVQDGDGNPTGLYLSSTGVSISGFVATTAQNIVGGTAGSILYQTGASTTGFVAPSFSGYVLVSNGASAPSWSNTAPHALTSNATTNLAGGTAGAVPYQSAAGVTSYVSPGSVGQVLTSSGLGAPVWAAAPSSIATALAGGSAGQIAYQTGANTTGFVGAGTYGQFLISNGTSAPFWATVIASSLGALAIDGSNSMTAALNMAGYKVTNLATPTAATDAATKSYVDSVATGLNVKAACTVATTGNITLSGIQSVDGVPVGAGQRVLVKNQTNAAENGIYDSASGAWTRSSDADSWSELVGATVFIEYGAVNDLTTWVCNVTAGGTLGTTPVVFVQFSATQSYTAGVGLTLVGNEFRLISPVSVSNGGTGVSSLTGVLYGNAGAPVTTATGAQIASSIGMAPVLNASFAGTCSGNSQTATALQTARTINGVPFDGTTNITIPSTSTYSVTFNNSGSGAASGVTYNGSTAQTISYNTVGAPSTIGTNASGTWPINITGNAATATNAAGWIQPSSYTYTTNLVGINKTIPVYNLDVQGVVNASGNFNPGSSSWTLAAFRAAGSYGGGLSFVDGTAGWALWTDAAGAQLNIGQSSTSAPMSTKWTINSAGALALGGNYGTAGQVLTSSGGGAMTWSSGGTDLRLFNILDYGASSGGSATTNTTAFTNAVAAANAAGGGVVFIPRGTYQINGSITIYSKIIFVGEGQLVSVVRRASGFSGDMFITDGFAGYNAVPVASEPGAYTLSSGPYQFGFKDMMIDGARGAGGWCLRIFGCGYTIVNLKIINCPSGGFYSRYWLLGTAPTYNGSTNLDTQMEAQILNLYVSGSSSYPVFAGPHDSQIDNMIVSMSMFGSSSNSNPCILFDVGAQGSQVNNLHAWSPYTMYCVYISGAYMSFSNMYADNCLSGGSLVVLATSNTVVEGKAAQDQGRTINVLQVGTATYAAAGNHVKLATWGSPGGTMTAVNAVSESSAGNTIQIDAVSNPSGPIAGWVGYRSPNTTFLLNTTNNGASVPAPLYQIPPIYTNGTYGTAGQFLTSSGGGAMTWSSGGGGSQWTTSGSNIYYNTGNVGFNNASPTQRIDVTGTVRATGSFTPTTSSWTNGAFRADGSWGGAISLIDGPAGWGIWAESSGDNINFGQGSTSGGLTKRWTINSSGALALAGNYGTAGQVLTSSGGGAMTWSNASGGWTQSGSVSYTFNDVLQGMTSVPTNAIYGDMRFQTAIYADSTSQPGYGNVATVFCGGVSGYYESAAGFATFKTRGTTPTNLVALHYNSIVSNVVGDDISEISGSGTDGNFYIKAGYITYTIDSSGKGGLGNVPISAGQMPTRLVLATRRGSLTTPVNGRDLIGRQLVIAVSGSTNFIAMGAASNAVGTAFICTSNGSGTGSVYDASSYSDQLIPGIVIDSNQILQFPAYGAGTLSTTSNGYVTTSDSRYKIKTRSIQNGSDIVKQLNPTYYRWKDSSPFHGEYEELGFIAQEVAAVIPEASPEPESDNKMKNYHDRAIIAILVESVKEILVRLDALESKINSMQQ